VLWCTNAIRSFLSRERIHSALTGVSIFLWASFNPRQLLRIQTRIGLLELAQAKNLGHVPGWCSVPASSTGTGPANLLPPASSQALFVSAHLAAKPCRSTKGYKNSNC
jgi:hypothetical protein